MSFVQRLVRHIKRNDNVFLVCYGRVGSGKSTFAYQLVKKVCNSVGLDFFYTYDIDEVVDVALNMENVFIVFDEVAYYLSSYSDREKSERVRKIFQTTRVKKISFCLISPFGIEMSKLVRRYADYVFVMKKKGVAVVYRVEREYLRGRVWAVRLGVLRQRFSLEESEINEMNTKKNEFLRRIRKEIQETQKRSEGVPLLL